MTELLQSYLSLLTHEAEGLQLVFAGQFHEVFESILVYAFGMSILWTSSSFIYWLRRQMKPPARALRACRSYSVLIPFHGEPDAALRSAASLASVRPQPAEILLIDDGSPEGIPLDAELPERARVVRLEKRRGKAGALNEALGLVTSEIVVCIDADTEARSSDWHGMLASFDDAELGAVTGMIWPEKQKSLIGRFQELDYLAVISVIKSAETVWGGLLTVSGAFVAYRRTVVESLGGWREDKAAEDIDISWRMQCAGWRILYDNSWTCCVEMAPTFTALWRQRRRWSSGLGQALRDYGSQALLRGARHLPVVIVSIANIAWIACVIGVALGSIVGLASGGGADLTWSSAFNAVRAAEIGLMLFSLQFLCATLIDGRPWHHYPVLLLILPLYPFYFWSVLASSFLAGFPRGVLSKRLGVWQPTIRHNMILRREALT